MGGLEQTGKFLDEVSLTRRYREISILVWSVLHGLWYQKP